MTRDTMTDGAATVRLCPICRKPAVERFRPFCSRRCADVDLHRWFGEVYTVPVKDADEDEDGAGGAARQDEER